MDWNAVGAIGQLLSAAVLAFALVQVRQARKDARRAVSRTRTDALRGLTQMQMNERTIAITLKAQAALGVPTLSPVARALIDRAGLTPEEAAHMFWLLTATWDYQAQTIANIDELPDIERIQFDRGIGALYGPGGGLYRLFYEVFLKTSAHPDALRYVDAVLARAGT